ncbi:MAG: cupin domain-containing protein [Sphingobacteriia bacterium]|nr:cupin domain-containing protein [Sphingobacteriia bacterium]
MQAIIINNIQSKEIATGYFAKLVHSEKMTFSFIQVKAGYAIKEHSHPHEQVSIVQKGVFKLVIEGVPVEFTDGELVVIPANARHSGIAITDCELLDVFTPVREDYQKL